jgi:hypothetical protein
VSSPFSFVSVLSVPRTSVVFSVVRCTKTQRDIHGVRGTRTRTHETTNQKYIKKQQKQQKMQVQLNEAQAHAHAQIEARAWLRSLRHVDTTLDLLLHEERFLQHVVSKTDEDIVCNASLAFDAEASSLIAREAVTFLSL